MLYMVESMFGESKQKRPKSRWFPALFNAILLFGAKIIRLKIKLKFSLKNIYDLFACGWPTFLTAWKTLYAGCSLLQRFLCIDLVQRRIYKTRRGSPRRVRLVMKKSLGRQMPESERFRALPAYAFFRKKFNLCKAVPPLPQEYRLGKMPSTIIPLCKKP